MNIWRRLVEAYYAFTRPEAMRRVRGIRTARLSRLTREYFVPALQRQLYEQSPILTMMMKEKKPMQPDEPMEPIQAESIFDGHLLTITPTYPQKGNSPTIRIRIPLSAVVAVEYNIDGVKVLDFARIHTTAPGRIREIEVHKSFAQAVERLLKNNRDDRTFMLRPRVARFADVSKAFSKALAEEDAKRRKKSRRSVSRRAASSGRARKEKKRAAPKRRSARRKKPTGRRRYRS